MNGFNILCLLLWVTLAHGYSQFRNIIPNGHYVKHPCKFGESWPAVGHMKSTFSPDFNAFGLDLKAAPEKRWTRALCIKDSDGDGLTNGQELGDPYCTWVEGQPAPGRYLGHPGFCEENRQSCRSCKIPTDCKYGNKYGCDKQGQSQNNRTRGRGREHTPMNINPTKHMPNQQNGLDTGMGIFRVMRPQDTGSFLRNDIFRGAPSFYQESRPGRSDMTMSPGGFNRMGVPSGTGIPGGIGGPSRISRHNFMDRPTGMGNPSGIGGQSRMSETFGLPGMGSSQSGFPSSGSAGTGGSPGGFRSPSFRFTPPREGPGGSGAVFTHDFGISGTNHHQLPFTGTMPRGEIQISVQDSMRRVGGMPSSTFPGGSGPSRGMSRMSMVPGIPGVFMGPMTYPF